MSKRSRVRRVPDLGRLREAMSGPGADPRSWVVLARVDDDEDGVRWETGIGWIVDVTFTFGDLAGEGPVACRVAAAFGGDREGTFAPVRAGAEVMVLLPGGDPMTAPLIVGVAFNTQDVRVPTTVNGQDIDEDFAQANHILVTTASVQQQVGEVWRTSATDRATLEAPEVRLANEDADQSFVRGEDAADAADALADATDDFGQQVLTAFTNLVPAGPPVTPVTQVQAAAAVTTITTAYAQLAAAVARFKSARNTYLSSKIKGE
jgi:uncharacterized protein involved in type VI secretion and phage assembly